MGKVYDIEKEKISEQSKKEICEACKEMAKHILILQKKQLKEFEKNFYIVADKYVFGAKKNRKFERPLALCKRSVYNLLRK